MNVLDQQFHRSLEEIKLQMSIYKLEIRDLFDIVTYINLLDFKAQIKYSLKFYINYSTSNNLVLGAISFSYK